MRHITIVTTTIYPDLGGGELYMFNLAQEFVKDNYKVSVLCITHEKNIPEFQMINGIYFYYLKHFTFLGKSFPALFQTSTKLFELKPDIIYSSGPSITDFVVVISNFFLKSKLVMTYHAMHDQTIPLLRFFTTIYIKTVMPFYKSIIVTTKKYFDILEKRGIKNMHLIPVGVEASKFDMENISLKQKNQNILFVGVLDENHRYKNLRILLQAMETLHDYHLDVVGDGELRKEFELYCRDNSINNVAFHGAITGETLKEYYKNAEIFVLPSNSSLEGFGIVLLEAIGNGCKIITGELAGGAFLIQNNNIGSLYNGSVENLIEQIQKIHTTSILDKEQVQGIIGKYSWHNVSQEIIKTFPDNK